MNIEKERLIKAIEKLNQEKKQILNSKQYKLGNSILEITENLKHFRFIDILKKVIYRHKMKVENRKLNKYKKINNEESNNNYISVEDKKIVVYTCITGDYDEISEPLYHNNNVDYVIYTNSENIKVNEWKKRPIPENIEKMKDDVLINRYIKMHPKELFNEYDYSIYIDGNVRTVSDISCFVNTINEKTGLSLHRHDSRNCIYQEAKVCTLYKKGNISKVKQQINKYKQEGFPPEYGLLQCNIIVNDLKNNHAEKILEEWWREFLKSESKRDQMSLPYVLWKQKYKVEDIGNLGNNVKNNSKIEIVMHNKEKI